MDDSICPAAGAEGQPIITLGDNNHTVRTCPRGGWEAFATGSHTCPLLGWERQTGVGFGGSCCPRCGGRRRSEPQTSVHSLSILRLVRGSQVSGLGAILSSFDVNTLPLWEYVV